MKNDIRLQQILKGARPSAGFRACNGDLVHDLDRELAYTTIFLDIVEIQI